MSIFDGKDNLYNYDILRCHIYKHDIHYHTDDKFIYVLTKLQLNYLSNTQMNIKLQNGKTNLRFLWLNIAFLDHCYNAFAYHQAFVAHSQKLQLNYMCLNCLHSVKRLIHLHDSYHNVYHQAFFSYSTNMFRLCVLNLVACFSQTSHDPYTEFLACLTNNLYNYTHYYVSNNKKGSKTGEGRQICNKSQRFILSYHDTFQLKLVFSGIFYEHVAYVFLALVACFSKASHDSYTGFLRCLTYTLHTKLCYHQVKKGKKMDRVDKFVIKIRDLFSFFSISFISRFLSSSIIFSIIIHNENVTRRTICSIC